MYEIFLAKVILENHFCTFKIRNNGKLGNSCRSFLNQINAESLKRAISPRILSEIRFDDVYLVLHYLIPTLVEDFMDSLCLVFRNFHTEINFDLDSMIKAKTITEDKLNRWLTTFLDKFFCVNRKKLRPHEVNRTQWWYFAAKNYPSKLKQITMGVDSFQTIRYGEDLLSLISQVKSKEDAIDLWETLSN